MIRERVKYLQERLEAGEAALISSDAGRLYYTGFKSSAGYAAVTADKAVFFIDFRYYEKARETVKSCEVVLLSAFYKQLADFLSSENVKTVLLETGSVTLESYDN